MSRSNCLIAWLLQAGLAAVFLAVMAPGASAATFAAGVSQSGTDVGVCITSPGSTGSSSPVSASIACLGNGSGGATSSASVGHVGASANGLDNGTGGFQTAASASLVGNVIFTGIDPTAIPGTTNVSLNLNFGGTLSATMSAGAEVRASSDLFGQAIGSVLISGRCRRDHLQLNISRSQHLRFSYGPWWYHQHLRRRAPECVGSACAVRGGRRRRLHRNVRKRGFFQ